MKRNNAGQFIKGTHWRPKQPFWNREWLEKEYVINGRSAVEIAQQFGKTENTILFWLHKHGIKCRSMKEIRKSKHWGANGESNPMFGKYGNKNPRWKGGVSPVRQSMYARYAWKELSKAIYARDKNICQDCGETKNLIIHHKKSWSKFPELRFEPSNLIVICEKCHKKIHQKKT